MFGSVLTIAFTLLLGYALWRASSVPLLTRHLSPKGFIVLGVALWVLLVLGRHLGHGGRGRIAATLELVGMNLLGWVLLVSLALFIVDLATAFGRLAPRRAPALRGAGLAAGTLLTALALVQGLRAPAVVTYEVTLPNLRAELDGTVLVAMSDTHVGTQIGGSWLGDRARQVQALHPDIVVLLGDIFEGHGDVAGDLAPLAELSAPLGKWFVIGNHESHPGQDQSKTAILQAAGFRRLANAHALLAPGLVLAGVDDLTHHERRNLGGDPLSLALDHRPPGATVLLSHSPRQVDRAAHAGVQLMLSGHTHGGQIWPFGYLVQAANPYLAGRYDVAGMPLVVSRGAGTWGPRMRLWRRGEIVVVRLRSSERIRLGLALERAAFLPSASASKRFRSPQSTY